MRCRKSKLVLVLAQHAGTCQRCRDQPISRIIVMPIENVRVLRKRHPIWIKEKIAIQDLVGRQCCVTLHFGVHELTANRFNFLGSQAVASNDTQSSI